MHCGYRSGWKSTPLGNIVIASCSLSLYDVERWKNLSYKVYWQDNSDVIPEPIFDC